MAKQELILFLWPGSPWASKVQTYLALRGIPHTVCPQPVTLPRPDLAALGVKYRRVPVIAVGRDLYADSLLILDKLEEWYSEDSHLPIGAKDNTGRALEKLFEKWTDLAVFAHAASAIPSDLELVQDPVFQKDREALWGRSWSKTEQDRLRPTGLANLRTHMDFLESLLSDGRPWIHNKDGPGLADIHACWIFDWMFAVPGAMPETFFNKQRYPNAISWQERYHAAVEKAKQTAPQPKELVGNDAVKQILNSELSGSAPQVEEDPSGFQNDARIEVFPIDTGSSHRQEGKLIGLDSQEVVLAITSEQDNKELYIHFPRWNFGIEPTSAANGEQFIPLLKK